MCHKDNDERKPTYCVRCQMRKVQKYGRWCNECFDFLDNERRIDWVTLTNTQFNVYGTERNAPTR